jgi:predicted DNA-binding transcriptional regulator AlpA
MSREHQPGLIYQSQVMQRTTLTKSELSAEVQAGRFPAPVIAPTGATVWREADVHEWIASRPRAFELTIRSTARVH